jgi:flagellar basal-body rod modification protein FlgD
MGYISPLGTDSNGNELTTGSLKELGKDEFMQLLVTKLQNQDPLDPMDDEAFIAELAQFSSLEQLQNLNSNLETALNWDYLQMQTINNTMATSLIGNNVVANFSNIYLDDANVPEIGYSTDNYADSIKVTITDIDGNVVNTLYEDNVVAGEHTVAWDGKDADGNRLAVGFYQVEITGTDVDGNSFKPSTYLEGRVTGVVYRDGSAYLKVNGLEIPLSDVSVINEPDSQDEDDG